MFSPWMLFLGSNFKLHSVSWNPSFRLPTPRWWCNMLPLLHTPLLFFFSTHTHAHTRTYTLTHKHTHSALLGNSWPQANKHSRKAAESPERINAARLPHGLTAWSFICTETPHDRQKTLFRSTVLWGTHVAASFFCSVCWAFSFWLVRQNKTVRASVHLFI